MTLPLLSQPLPDPESGRDIAWVPLVRSLLLSEGQLRWRVEGRSMEPTLPSGCEIEIVPVRGALRTGDLVLFVVQDTLIVHRLVQGRQGGWVAQGDSRSTPDPLLTPEAILGRVVRATYEGEQCWPYRYYRVVAFFWLFRYHLLRVRRLAHRYFAFRLGI